MPLGKRRSDEGPRQEWMVDISQNGEKSGSHALTVVFDCDDPNGTWTTHLFPSGNHGKRLNRGSKTAIVVEGLSRERAEALTTLIHQDIELPRANVRTKILNLLDRDKNLRWLA